MKIILDFTVLQKYLDEKWSTIEASSTDKKKVAIAEYMDFFREQYEKGSLGYMIFPYYITSLLAVNAEKYEELEDIIDLACTLELPNQYGETNPRIRLDETERLSKMIKDFCQQNI